MKKPAGISISVNGQDCTGIIGDGPVGHRGYSPETLEAIGDVFYRAAEAIRRAEHGEIRGQDNIANIGVEQKGGAFDDETGLPVLVTIRIARKVRRRATGHGPRGTNT